MARIHQRDALGVLTRLRLLDVAAALGVEVSTQAVKAKLTDAIARSPRAPLPRILELLRRDELKAICRFAGLNDSGRAKVDIADRILGGRPDAESATLTKADLVEELVAAQGLLKREAESIVNATLEAMTDSLRANSQIELRGFGSFRFRDRLARTGRNPATGALVRVPAKRICYFRPGRSLLSSINASALS